jgi:hypothetical protein
MLKSMSFVICAMIHVFNLEHGKIWTTDSHLINCKMSIFHLVILIHNFLSLNSIGRQELLLKLQALWYNTYNLILILIDTTFLEVKIFINIWLLCLYFNKSFGMRWILWYYQELTVYNLFPVSFVGYKISH